MTCTRCGQAIGLPGGQGWCQRPEGRICEGCARAESIAENWLRGVQQGHDKIAQDLDEKIRAISDKDYDVRVDVSKIHDAKEAQREMNAMMSALAEHVGLSPMAPGVLRTQPSWWERAWFRLSMKWWAFIQRWKYRPHGTAGAQTPPMVEEQRVKEYSAAVTPAPWTEDITKHNANVSKDYAEEVERRKAAMLAGEYHPRFYLDFDGAPTNGPLAPGILRDPEAVSWALEMSMRPGARVDVTNDYEKRFRLLTPLEIADIKYETMARKAVDSAANLIPIVPRAIVGSREDILKACGGDEALADQVEQKAREFLGVRDLDAPLPTGKR